VPGAGAPFAPPLCTPLRTPSSWKVQNYLYSIFVILLWSHNLENVTSSSVSQGVQFHRPHLQFHRTHTNSIPSVSQFHSHLQFHSFTVIFTFSFTVFTVITFSFTVICSFTVIFSFTGHTPIAYPKYTPLDYTIDRLVVMAQKAAKILLNDCAMCNFFQESEFQARNQGGRSGGLQNLSPPLEKCVGHSWKLLNIV